MEHLQQLDEEDLLEDVTDSEAEASTSAGTSECEAAPKRRARVRRRRIDVGRSCAGEEGAEDE